MKPIHFHFNSPKSNFPLFAFSTTLNTHPLTSFTVVQSYALYCAMCAVCVSTVQCTHSYRSPRWPINVCPQRIIPIPIADRSPHNRQQYEWPIHNNRTSHTICFCIVINGQCVQLLHGTIIDSKYAAAEDTCNFIIVKYIMRFYSTPKRRYIKYYLSY